MPTYSRTDSFYRDHRRLSSAEQKQFMAAVRKFIVDLRSGRFRAGLRVRGVEGAAGVFEMTWAKDGRATFEYGPELMPDEPHTVWRRCGGHDIFTEP